MKILYIDCFFGFDASMLLGALIDAGASPYDIEGRLVGDMEDFRLEVSDTLRCSIECKIAAAHASGSKTELCREIMQNHGQSPGTYIASMEAVLSAMEILDIEYVMCSDIGVRDGTDGQVLSVLDKAGIEVLPSEPDTPKLHISDAVFLKSIISECGPKPQMDIISIGYGAGLESGDTPHLITAIIGQFNPEGLFEKESREELISML